MPPVRLVFRVGVTGHLSGTDSPELSVVTGDILTALREQVKALTEGFYAAFPVPCDRPPAELRLVAQLAAGADQLAANLAVARGYRVYGVLPFSEGVFAKDIENSKGGMSARQEFERLMKSGDVAGAFELPCDAGTPESRDQAYAEANRVILNQIDLLIVMARPDAGYRFGGSVWMREIALDQRIPAIFIPVDNPHNAQLIWTHHGQRRELRIYLDGSANWPVLGEMVEDILVTKARHKEIPRLTCQYLHRVPLYKTWDDYGHGEKETWPEDAVRHGLRNTPNAIDNSFQAAYCWADHMARGYAEINRGTFVLAALMGTTAVAAAVLSVPFPGASWHLKLAEVLVIAVILWLYYRDKSKRWRLRWLNYRQMAEQFRHARYLLLLGRSIPVEVPKHVAEFHDEAVWENWYVRAMLRQAALPHACLDRDYMAATRLVLETCQVSYQTSFYEKSREKQHAAERKLESGIGMMVWTVLVATFAFVVCKCIPAMKSYMSVAAPWITIIGALFPAGAAALSAIKSNGEYAQNAVRYRGMAFTLRAAGKQLGEIQGWVELDLPRGYEKLVKLATATADYLLQEVYQWRSMLQLKGIERS
jgi:hypothetical protein